jgi:hypothetical protein
MDCNRLCFMQEQKKLNLDYEEKQVHVHLSVGNIVGCFFNFKTTNSSSFPFAPNPEI